jgi:hypothetical protein
LKTVLSAWFLLATRDPVTPGTTFIILSSYGENQRNTDDLWVSTSAGPSYAAFLFVTPTDFAFAARSSLQRFLVAAIIFCNPSGLILRFGLLLSLWPGLPVWIRLGLLPI